MANNFQKNIDFFKSSSKATLLRSFKCGLEREVLRVNSDGQLATTQHPEKLGSSLFHRSITTDFSEAQLEFISPPLSSTTAALNYMKHLHCFVSQNIDDQLLWPFSMPGMLPDEKNIPIAEFGTSNLGKKKHLYRLGLSERYGRKMQTVSGTHYNFSFSRKFWEYLHQSEKSQKNLPEYISDKYFHIIRNFLKLSWINTYLFGSTPAADSTYFKKIKKPLKKHKRRTYILPFGTSLRMSNMGYFSKVQSQIAISYNSLEQYLKDMHKAISTPEKAYRKKNGLNGNILQSPAEHYSRIRPKSVDSANIGTLESLAQGVEYLEIRAVDLNPFIATGQNKSQLLFLNCLIAYCLFLDSPNLTKSSIEELMHNQIEVALYGRKPKLNLKFKGKKRSLESWLESVLSDLQQIATIFDTGDNTKIHSNAILEQFNKLKHPSFLPSAQILHELEDRNLEFIELGLQLANEQRNDFCKSKLPISFSQKQQKEVELSLLKQKNQEIIDQTYLSGYEDLELSTQLLLKEAIKRKVDFEILDRKSNFIRLSKGRKKELVMQATHTAYDSQITHFLMENKVVSKKILHENNLRVPFGKDFNSLSDALADYDSFKGFKIVVKPNDTNFGIGITFVEKNSKSAYEQALRLAFSHSDTVIIEEFIAGPEYRFLVVDRKCIAVVNRVPANVQGDGKSTILELVAAKNSDYNNYKFFPGYQIQLGKIEIEFLANQNLTPKSVLDEGQLVFLRGNSNVSTGGDAHDYTNEMSIYYKHIAEKAAIAADAELCGVDMIVPDLHQAKGDYGIIEINFNPSLQIHAFPLKGEVINVAAPVLDLLGF